MAAEPPSPIGTDLPAGTAFVGTLPGTPGWAEGDAPDEADLNACVSCGLCLPHCPTYRLTGEEPASPRGRISAMRAVTEGTAAVNDTFASFMDACLVCRACEDVCPSHVPFGRMMERARVQIEPLRTRRHRFMRRLGLNTVLAHPKMLWAAVFVQPVVTRFLPKRIRAVTPKPSARFSRVPAVTEPPAGVVVRGTVAVLTGCVQDRWFRDVNLATVRVLARNGWRVVVPRDQVCCGALHAHNGQLDAARRLAGKNAKAFAGVDHVIVNAAGCGAHMSEYGDLVDGVDLPVEDLMVFLDREGLAGDPVGASDRRETVVAYHDACHALRAQHIREEPRRLLRRIPGLRVVDIVDGDRCCGAAGLYQVTQPEMSSRLMREKADRIRETGASIVASANPGCTIQIVAGLRELGAEVEVVHPVQLLDRAFTEPSRV